MPSTAAATIAAPPVACTVRRSAPSRATDAAAPFTVLGMSWSLRSRNTLRPRDFRAFTASGPAAANNSSPIFASSGPAPSRWSSASAASSVGTSNAIAKFGTPPVDPLLIEAPFFVGLLVAPPRFAPGA